jgi:hypothetical protein
MDITWAPEKERTLRKQRGIEIREIADLIVDGRYNVILENPSRPAQFIFVLPYHGYTHVVPFVIGENGTIILKTVFPSRKFHQLYGEGHEGKT